MAIFDSPDVYISNTRVISMPCIFHWVHHGMFGSHLSIVWNALKGQQDLKCLASSGFGNSNDSMAELGTVVLRQNQMPLLFNATHH